MSVILFVAICYNNCIMLRGGTYEARYWYWRRLLQGQRPQCNAGLVQATPRHRRASLGGGAAFDWTDADGKSAGGTTAWSIVPAEDDAFAPSTSSFMVNYRVADVRALLKALREEGCNVLDKLDDSEYGKFGWVVDPEGNKVELWEPPAGQ